MSRLVKTLKEQFRRMASKRQLDGRPWDTVYIAVDMHETVFTPTWNTTVSETPYPKAIETLKLMSEHPNIKLILWSSSLPHINEEYKIRLAEKGIDFCCTNNNPFEENTTYADFKSKPYFSLILDDKAAFEPSDWVDLYDYMVLLKSLELLELYRDYPETEKFLCELQINLKYGY